MSEIQVLSPQSKDLGGGFLVRRLLPSAARPSVGPFVFFDHFGPVTHGPQDATDVRPHPHIGLATLTCLFEGELLHRDSTGAVQRIAPGAVNLMTAGRGIVHSERTPDDLRGRHRRSHGLQLWMALPAEHEEDAPAFQHVPATDIPVASTAGAQVRVLIGQAFGLSSPVRTLSPTLALDLSLAADAGGPGLRLPSEMPERALYSVDQPFVLDGQIQLPHHLVVLPSGAQPVLSAPQGARLVLVGGETLGHRFLVWNFVSSRRARILQAQDDWEAQRFDSVPGETEFIPLPRR